MKRIIYVLNKKKFDNDNVEDKLRKLYKAVYVVDSSSNYEDYFNFDKVGAIIVIDNIDSNKEIMSKIFRLRGTLKFSELALVCERESDFYFGDKRHYYEVKDMIV